MTEVTENTPVLYAPNTAAKLLSVSRATLYLMMKHGNLAWVQLGADRRIPASEIQRIAREGTPTKSVKAV